MKKEHIWALVYGQVVSTFLAREDSDFIYLKSANLLPLSGDKSLKDSPAHKVAKEIADTATEHLTD
jgi:hypothetical protein